MACIDHAKSVWVSRHGGAKSILELFFCGSKEEARKWERAQCLLGQKASLVVKCIRLPTDVVSNST